MDPILAGGLGTGLVFLLLFIGMPIAFAMFFVGFVGVTYLTSAGAALPVRRSEAAIWATGLTDRAVQAMFGHHRGGMGMVVLDPVKRQLESPGKMGAEIVGVQVTGGGDRFDFVQPFEVGERLAVEL